VSDIVRAAEAGTETVVRNPHATRPWQDVLDCLAAYLMIGHGLLNDRPFAMAWNIGPPPWQALTVGEVVEQLAATWPGGLQWRIEADNGPHEATFLALDATRARTQLGWQPLRSLADTALLIGRWHTGLATGSDARALTDDVLDDYERRWQRAVGVQS
jgi:CDP-glucose 4,6-dehydratase